LDYTIFGCVFPLPVYLGKEIEDNREAITKSLTTTSETKLSSGVNFLSSVKSVGDAPQKEKSDVSDVFAKFMKK